MPNAPDDGRQISRAMVYLPMVLVVLLLGVGSIILLVYMRPTQDNTPTITIIVGMLTPTVVSILTLLQSKDNQVALVQTQAKVDATHDLVNGGMAALVEATRVAAEAVGTARGIAQQQHVYAEQIRLARESDLEKTRATAQAAADVLKTAAEAASKKDVA